MDDRFAKKPKSAKKELWGASRKNRLRQVRRVRITANKGEKIKDRFANRLRQLRRVNMEPSFI